MCEDLLGSCVDKLAVCPVPEHEEVPDDDGMWVGSASTARSRSTRWRWSRARCGPGRVWQPDRERFRRWLADDVDRTGSWWRRSRWRWRVAPVGVTWSRRSSPLGSRRIWPSRPTRRRRGVASGGRRPIAATVGCSRAAAGWPVAGVVDPADGGVGVARTGPAVQDVGRSTLDVGATDPRRAVSARGGVAGDVDPLGEDTRAAAKTTGLVDRGPATGRRRVSDDRCHSPSHAVEGDLQRFGRRQPGCRALVEHQYGIGGLLAVVMWSELGDCQRFTRSEQVVRHSGLDVTVDPSDRRRAGGFLSRQGPQTLRWALYEAAKNASHQRSPDHDYYADVKDHPTASWPPSRWPASSPGAASTCCGRSTPTWSTRSRHLNSPVEVDGRHRPPTHHGSSAVSSRNRRARQHPCWTAFEH